MNEKLSVVLLYLERSLPQDCLYLLMVEALLQKNGLGQFFNFVFIQFDLLLSQDRTFLDYSLDFFVYLGSRLLTVNVLAFCLDGGVVREQVAHAEPKYHGLDHVTYFHQIVSCSAGTLNISYFTSLKKCSSDIRPPSITQI